jgi:hypothetical protein
MAFFQTVASVFGCLLLCVRAHQRFNGAARVHTRLAGLMHVLPGIYKMHVDGIQRDSKSWPVVFQQCVVTSSEEFCSGSI